MPQEYQLIITAVLFGIALYGFYNTLKTNAIKQATEIALLQTEVMYLKKSAEEHNRRLDDHDNQNKALVALTEQIKSLSSDVQDLKVELRSGRYKA